jgi:hypothetical protein
MPSNIMPKSIAKSARLPLAIACALAGTTPAFAQSNAEFLKEIQALKSRLQELEKKIAEPPDAKIKPPPSPPSDKSMPVSKPDESGFVKWNELVAGKSRLKLYGFLRADAIFDDSRPGAGGTAGNPNATLIPAYILNENAAAVPGLGGLAGVGLVNNAPAPNAEDFTVHPRLTRLGLDFTGPEIPGLWNAKTGGKLEIDFYNLTGTSESREFLRMRHAYLTLKWDDVSLLAGQTVDLISPTLRAGEASGLPTVQARVAYRFPVAEKLNAELGGWVHYARERFDTPIGTSSRQTFYSEAAGLDLMVPLYKDLLTLKGELWTGKNLDDVRGGILQGVNPTSGREIHAVGGWAELTYKPKKWTSLHGGYTFDNPRRADLLSTGGAVVTANAPGCAAGRKPSRKSSPQGAGQGSVL